MSVSQKSTITIDHTWTTRGALAWSDAEMRYKWSSMTVRSHEVAAEEALKTTDGQRKTIRVPKTDAFRVVDSIVKRPTVAPSIRFAITDGNAIARSVAKVNAISLKIAETAAKRYQMICDMEFFGVTSFDTKSIRPNYAVALHIAEATRKGVWHEVEVESLGIAPSTANFPHVRAPEVTLSIANAIQEKTVLQNLARTLTVGEAKAMSVNKPVEVESLALEGSIANMPMIHKMTDVSIAEVEHKDFWQSLMRSLDVAEAKAVLYDQQTIEDTLTVVGLLANVVFANKITALKVAEEEIEKSITSIVIRELQVTDEHAMRFDQSLLEFMQVVDVVAKLVRAPKQEVAFRIADSIRKGVKSSLADAIGISDRTAFWFESMLNEVVSVKDVVKSTFWLNRHNSVVIEEAGLSKSFAKRNISNLLIKEVFDRKASFFRTLEDAIKIQDVVAKKPTKASVSGLRLLERLVMPANMVIADITASELGRDREFSHDDFISSVDRVPMPGWTQWRNFLHGEYEYSKGMFRIVMDAMSADRALIEECEIAIDVPDVIDRGSTRITDAQASTGAYVEFNREYHIIPEVTLTARGGISGGNPIAAELVGSPTLLGFTARLRDTVTGQYMAGTFTWASIGY